MKRPTEERSRILAGPSILGWWHCQEAPWKSVGYQGDLGLLKASNGQSPEMWRVLHWVI